MLLTNEQAAAFLGVSRSAWFRLVAAGEVRAVNVPSVGPRFRRVDLEVRRTAEGGPAEGEGWGRLVKHRGPGDATPAGPHVTQPRLSSEREPDADLIAEEYTHRHGRRMQPWYTNHD